jgi:hypothetical protein
LIRHPSAARFFAVHWLEAGDLFVISAGFERQLDVLETTRQVRVMCQPVDSDF